MILFVSVPSFIAHPLLCVLTFVHLNVIPVILLIIPRFGIWITFFIMFPLQPQNQQATPSKHHMQSLSHQPQFHPIHQNHSIHQTQHSAHFSHSHQCGPQSHLPEIAHAHQSPTIPQHMACLQPITGGHVSGRLHVLVRVS